MKKTKFNNLNDLLHEIDSWIDILQAKRADILKAKGDINNKEVNYSYDSVLDICKKNFTSYTISVYKDNYDLLVKKAEQIKMSISSFLKKKYLLSFLNNINIYKDKEKIRKFLTGRIVKGRKEERKTIGLALDDKDNRKFLFACKQLKVNTPKELLRFIFELFLYDVLSGGKIRGDENFNISQINFINCISSNISGYSYDKQTKTLYIKFIGEIVYAYKNVPEKIYLGLCEAESKGQYFNKYILPKQEEFNYKKIRG